MVMAAKDMAVTSGRRRIGVPEVGVAPAVGDVGGLLVGAVR